MLPVSVQLMVLLIALAALVAALVGGIAYAVVRGIQLWRDVKRSSSSFGVEVDRIGEVSLQIDRHIAAAKAATERLQVASGRLATSRARLDVQVAALHEARAQMRRTFWFVPGV
jgi:hypothetical protein